MTLFIKVTTMIMLFSFSHYPITFSTPLNPVSEFTSKINVQNLSKKWELDYYKFYFFSEDPAEEEKNDYIHLKSDMTYSSISEGEYDAGKWRLDIAQKRIFLSNNNEEGELRLIIDDLSANQLVLIIDDPSDSYAQYLKIFFKNR